MLNTLAFIGLPHGMEWMVILVVALLIFGKRLPSVAKGLGEGIVQFKKGLKGVTDEVQATEREIEAASSEPRKLT